jgi:hypothetical protein
LNFLSNLGTSLWNGISTVASDISGLAQQGLQRTGNLLGSLANLFPGGSSYAASANDAYNSATSVKNPLTPAPGPQTINTAVLPSSGQKDPFGNTIYNYQGQPTAIDKYGQVNQLGTMQAQSGSVGQSGYQAPQYTYTSTPQAPQYGAGQVDSFGRVSSPSQGNPYFDLNGNYVIPKQAFTGLSGSGTTQTSFSTPMTPTLAAQGQPGHSAFTGTLGSTGGLSTPAMITNPSEDEKKRQAGGITDILKGAAGQAFANSPITGPLAGLLQGGKSLLSFMGGNQVGNTVIPQNVPQVTPPTEDFSVKLPQQPINSGDLIAGRDNTNTGTTGGNYDIQDLNTKIASDYTTNYNQQLQQNPIPPPNQIIKDNIPEDVTAALQGSPEATKAWADYATQNTSMANLMAKRVDVMKQVQAITDTYKGVVNEIKANPNLPKKLALRRLEEVNKSQKDNLQGLLNEQQILEQSISDQKDIVNNAFQIGKAADDKAATAKRLSLDYLTIMVNSHAIGGFSESDIAQFSQSTGISATTLRNLKSAANNPDTKTTQLDDGTLIAIKTAPNGSVTTQVLGKFTKPVTVTPMDPASVDYYAQQYNLTRTLPAMGNGSGAVKTQILNRAAQLAAQGGQTAGDIVSNGASFKADSASLSKLQTTLDSVTAFEGTAKQNLQNYIALAKNVIDTKSPVVNQVFRGGARQITGSGAQAAADAARVVAFTEIAKVLNNPTSSATLSDSSRNEANSMLNGDYTIPQLMDVANVLIQDMENRKTFTQSQINLIKGRLSGSSSVTPTSSTSSTSTNSSTPPLSSFNFKII